MQKHRFTISLLFGMSTVMLAGFVPHARAAAATVQIPPVEPYMARVWFMRPTVDSIYNVGADPIIYANGKPVGEIAANTDFFYDFRPGTYKFSVQPYGDPTGQSLTLQLTAETQTYLEVEWAPRWEFGYASSGHGLEDHAFAVFPVTPQVAQAYLPTLKYRRSES